MFALALITITAVVLRFYRLDSRSLWLDEIFQAESAHLSSAGQVVQFAQADIDQMPLFFFVTWLLGRWSDSAFALRLPSAVIGVGVVLCVYALGARLVGRRMGLVAAVLMTVMPYAVWYSQEARNYALLMLLTTLQMYFAYSAVEKGRAVDWAGLAIFTLLNLYNHYLALLVTAAVAVFIGLAVLIAFLRPASMRAKVVAGMALVILAVAAVVVRWRPLLRSLYGFGSATVGRHPRSSLVLAGFIVAAVVAVLLWIDLRLRSARWRPALLRQLELAAGASAAIVIGYLPWIPYLRVFLGAPDKGIGRLDTTQGPHWAQILGIGPRMGWSGLVLVAFAAGIVTLFAWALRTRHLQSLLLACWLVVPTALLVASARWAIVDLDIRYLAWLFPGAVLVTAAGVEGGVTFAEGVLSKLHRPTRLVRSGSAAVAIVIVGMLLAQVIPALAAEYGTPKDDWRATATFISANSAPGSTVTSIGNYSDWAVISLSYYFRELQAPVRLNDGAQLTSDDVRALDQSSGMVWGVLNHPSAAQLDLVHSSGREVVAFVDVTHTIYVVRTSANDLSALDQERQLLRWEAPLEPALEAPAGMLDLVAQATELGRNVLPPPDASSPGWAFTSGAAADGEVLSLRPSASEVDATFTTSSLAPGDDLLLEFDHRSRLNGGKQLVYAVALDTHGHQIVATPSGAGYPCAPADDWIQSYFAFRVPAGTASVVLVFRATGSGIADFQKIELSQIQ